jgi:iron complex transport system ATP-binding protein
VLSGLTLSFDPGQVAAVVGPNGAGKTTLLRVLAGLLAPRRGQVSIAGRPLGSLSAQARAARLAYIPQAPDLAFPYSVSAFVGFGRFALGQRGRAPLVDEALCRVGLSDRAHEPLGTLSAGQRQRASIARALCQLAGPDRTGGRALLADEPTTALDPAHHLLVIEILREQASRGVAVVAVMHDLTAAAGCARAVLLGGQGVIADGLPESSLSLANLGRAFGVGFVHARDERGELVAIAPRRTRLGQDVSAPDRQDLNANP